MSASALAEKTRGQHRLVAHGMARHLAAGSQSSALPRGGISGAPNLSRSVQRNQGAPGASARTASFAMSASQSYIGPQM